MIPSFDIGMALVVFLPFAFAVLAPFLFRLFGRHAAWLLALVPAWSFAFLLTQLDVVAAGGARAGFDWVASYGLRLWFLLDGLSLTFALAITGIGTLILVYAGSYLKGEPHQGRFFAYMLMFMGAMLGVVLSDSLVGLFLFWEATSVSSFLLIGYDHTRQAARRAAIQALVVTGAGGLALLAGAILMRQVSGAWEISALLGLDDLSGHALYLPILLLVLGAAFTKSAQFPFQFWLPNAMEAPTPVSAFLHSATMVQAGVYLLMRLSPALGESMAWQTLLPLFGGVTLLLGALFALRETDLKQVLAQTTIASLGLSVLLIGLGTEIAAMAAITYFLAHALYKAALFLLAGAIDHGTGTRDLLELGGLARSLPLAFAGVVLAAASMFGLPLTLGFLGKEEIYLATGAGQMALAVMVVAVVGNALMGAVGLIIATRPFLGRPTQTPIAPHEAPVLVLPALLLAALGIAAAIFSPLVGERLLAPAAAAIAGEAVESHLTPAVAFTSPAFLLSVLTWALAIGLALAWPMLRTLLRRLSGELSFDRAFDALMFGLIRLSGAITRTLHHGKLEFYLFTVFVALAAALLLPPILGRGLPAWPRFTGLTFYEWGICLIGLAGLVAVLMARSRLTAIAALGIQGFAVAVIFLLFGAPDLSFTQFMVEVLTVVILALVMTRLRLDRRDNRPFEDLLRDGSLALLCGVGVTTALLIVLDYPLDMRLSDFFAQTSVPLAHGHNIVNVILVDYRGLDTLGEISVVMTAGIAILALIRRLSPKPAPDPEPAGTPPAPQAKPRRPRRARTKPKASGTPA